MTAEGELLDRYRTDDRLHPGRRIRTIDPHGEPPTDVDLEARVDGPRAG